ncbi:MAG: 4Fe-4S binding protein [Candidatus Bipolaricaulaceae bacterium]
MDRRQRVRKVLLLVSLLAFPATFYYFSPVLVLTAGAAGVVPGALVLFGVMAVTATVSGRAFCGWACPVGGLGELCSAVQNRPVSRRLSLIKYGIWFSWLAAVGLAIASAGGLRRVDFLYQTASGLSLADGQSCFVYGIVLAVVLTLSLAAGRRAFCHTVCWMAPFMVVGAWLGDRLHLPSLGLQVQPSACGECGRCTRDCPMSLDVAGMVGRGSLAHPECILCGRCVDSCPQGAIRLAFRRRGGSPAVGPAAGRQ